jgi:hypothetical protein
MEEKKNMKKKWLKKGSAVLLTAAMILSLFPGTKGTLATVQAAPNDAPTSGYWTDAAGLKEFGLSGTKTIGKIRFGASDRIWAICGADTDGSLALLSTSEFTPENPKPTYGSTSEYSQSNFVKDLDNYVSATENTSTYLSTTYFSTGELGKMADVTVSTNEPDGSGGNHLISVKNKKLYLPNSQDQNTTGTTIYVGSSNDIAIDVAKLKQANGFQENLFWLRSPYFNT